MNNILPKLRPNLLCSCVNYKIRLKSTEVSAHTLENDETKIDAKAKRSHRGRMNYFFGKNPHLDAQRPGIPSKYQLLKRNLSDHLYLIDSKIAEDVANIVYPIISQYDEKHIIAETNAGLGLITRNLLDKGVPIMRIYEHCPEFRNNLIKLNQDYPDRVELFTRDIFNLNRYAFIDYIDAGDRVHQLLKNVPKHQWHEGPVMTIIGTMSKPTFIKYLLRSISLQSGIVAYGRVQILAFMRPKDYVILNGNAEHNLHTYRFWSVLFSLFFECRLIKKYPREVFLPWETIQAKIRPRNPSKVDPNQIYFVEINLKKDLPTSKTEDLLALFHFVKHFFGKKRLIPELEKWVPGCGPSIMLPDIVKNADESAYFENMDIFTQTYELTPLQILSVFEQVLHYSAYEESPFKAMIDATLLKSETLDSDTMSLNLEKTIMEDIEIKLSLDD